MAWAFPLPVPKPHEVLERVAPEETEQDQEFHPPEKAQRRLGVRYVGVSVALVLTMRGWGP